MKWSKARHNLKEVRAQEKPEPAVHHMRIDNFWLEKNRSCRNSIILLSSTVSISKGGL